MKKVYSLLCALLLVGCGTGRERIPAPSTAAVARSMEVAGEGVARAEGALSKGRDSVALLEKTATAEQRPAVEAVQRSLEGATQELGLIRVSLAKGAEEAVLLQARIDGMAEDYGNALEREGKARVATARWRAWALRLGLLSGLLVAWVLRKPLLRLLGVPVL